MKEIISNDNYHKNTEAYPCRGDTYPCIICGKPCPNPKYMLWVHMGGTHAVTNMEGNQLNANGESGGDLGLQPIGADCLKRHPELDLYVEKV